MSRRSSGIGVLAVAVFICVYFIGSVGATLAAQRLDRQRLLAFTNSFLAQSARDAESRASAEREVNEARLTPAMRETGAAMGKAAQGTTMPAMMPTVAPLFLEDAHFRSTLVLVNAAALSTYADVTLTALNGDQIVKQRVQFTPHSQVRVDIGALLASAASVASAGSISVMQSPDLEGMVILAQLSITYQGSGEPNYIDEELQMPSMTGSSVLRGVAERSQGSPLLAITSLSASSQTVTIQCLAERGLPSSKSVALLAGETLLTQACTAATAYGADFETAMIGNDSRMRNSVGISLTSTAMPGEFAAFGLALHGDAKNRYFSEVSFTDPKMLVSPNTTFTGVPIGTSPLLPAGNYVPELALANFSPTAVHVHVKYATTSGTSPSILDAANLTLRANTTRWLPIDNLRAVDSLQNSFIVDSDGAPGDLMAKLISARDSQLHEVELPGKDELNVNNGGAHPWSLQNGNESTLLLFNHGTAPDTFNVAISTEGMTWQKAYQLAPMQTLAVSIGNLVQSRARDDKGNRLPQNAAQGMVNWFPPDAGNSSGRMLVSNKVTAMARSFSCDLGDFLCRAIVTGYTIYVNDNETVLFANVVGEICSGIPCTGTEVGQGTGFTYSWSATTPGILAISGSSTNSSVSALGQSPGTSSMDASVSASYNVNGRQYNCTEYGGQPGYVKPNITGPNTLWYFGGANPSGSTYPVQITLSEDAASGTWAVASGSDRINLSTTSGTSTTLTPTGSHFSGGVGDTCLTVTVSSETSDQFCISVRTPWKLVPSSPETDPDSVHGYVTFINYDVYDNLNSPITQDIYWNEALGTNQSENGSNWASCCGPIHPSPGDTPVSDMLEPPAIGNSPPPSPAPTYDNPPSGATAYLLVPQTIYVGSTTVLAVQVQSDDLTYYIDHGAHTSIVTPPRPPQ